MTRYRQHWYEIPESSADFCPACDLGHPHNGAELPVDAPIEPGDVIILLGHELAALARRIDAVKWGTHLNEDATSADVLEAITKEILR